LILSEVFAFLFQKQEADSSLLGYALLGLLQQQSSSGYDLRKIFASTPMQSFSDSPGAIYPALARLEKARLIRGRVEDRSGLRRRKVYSLTSAGLDTLKGWLNEPVRHERLVREWNSLILRFAFTDGVLGKGAGAAFLRLLVKELDAYLPTLHEYFAAQQSDMPTSGRLALKSGIVGYEAQLKWAKAALATYEKAKEQKRAS
jgi:DNA-binding PadR family transcriptional regulator